MVAYDTLFSDTPAHDDGLIGHGGCEMVELFVGTSSHLTDVVPMSAKSDFPEALREFIRKWGAPNKVMSDNAWEQTSKKVLEILRNYNIIKHCSEAGKQNQNAGERRMQDAKRTTQMLMDCTGTPAALWLLALLFVVGLFNHVANTQINDMAPITKAKNLPVDVSKHLHFRWLEPVCYRQCDGESFPSSNNERSGWWCGPAEDVGNVLC